MMQELPKYNLQINAIEAGILLGIIETSDPHTKLLLNSTHKQLIALKKDAEKASGTVKKLLPNGMMEVTDEDGFRTTRPPMSWEIKQN